MQDKNSVTSLEASLLNTFPNSVKILTTDEKNNSNIFTINIPLIEKQRKNLSQITSLIIEQVKRNQQKATIDCKEVDTIDAFGMRWMKKTSQEIERLGIDVNLINVDTIGLGH